MTFRAVSSVEELHEIVRVCSEVGAFAFDVESRGNISRWPDVLGHIEDEWKKKLSTLKTTHPDILARSKSIIEADWTKDLALNPLRNEVFWIGIATKGHSWAIPMGHKHGEVLVPEEIGDGTTVPPPGYREVTASGKESKRKAKYYIPAVYTDPPSQLSVSEVFEVLSPLFMSETIVKVGHNIKFDARSVRKYLGGDLPAEPYMDTIVMQHILNENLMAYDLSGLITLNFKHSAYHRDGKLGATIDREPFSKAARYVHLDARWTWLLYRKLLKKINKADGLMTALDQDMRTLYVLCDMEDSGIPVAKRPMSNLGKMLDAQIRDTLVEMVQHVPLSFQGFNPASPQSKAQLLFGKKSEGGLGLKSGKVTPSGNPSVDAKALEMLKDSHPIVPLLLKWSEDTKIKSTFVDSLLPKLVDGRLHPSFHLHRVATGRMASSDPNLQNIPRESAVRSLFVAPKGEQLLVFDYDQIELRVLCMYSHDKHMTNFFLTGQDIHAGAAALCLGKDVADVTPEERQMGKGVNFLTAYGGGYKKLALTTGIPEDQAKSFIDSYYEQFSGITDWKKKVLREVRQTGYVETMNGRRRRFRELVDDDYLRQRAVILSKSSGSSMGELIRSIQSQAERQAINAIIQGSAADLCKQAMINVHSAFKGTGAKLLVSVHDELVASCPDSSVDLLIPVMMESMGHGKVIDGIPLKVSGHAATSWAEAKGK